MSARTIRRFAEMFGLLSRGKFEQKVDEHLMHAIETLEALPSESGKATITMQIEIVFESGRLDIRPTVKSKLPEEKGFAGTSFWAHDGGLSVQHPSQLDMLAPRVAAPAREQA